MKGFKQIAVGILIASLLCSTVSPMAVMAEEVPATNTSEATDTLEKNAVVPKVTKTEDEIEKEKDVNLPEEIERVEPTEETNSKQDMPVTEAQPRDGTVEEIKKSIEDKAQTYRIQVEADSAFYEVSSDTEQAIPGEEVRVYATAEEGYHIRAIAAYGTEGNVVAGTIEDQELNFLMPEQDIKVVIYTSLNYVETIQRSGIRVKRSSREFLSGDIVQWVGKEVTGKANIGGYMSEGVPLESYFEVSGLEEIGFYGTVPIDSKAIWCRNRGAAEPANVEADLWAKCTKIENGMAYYDLILTPPGATDAEIDMGWDFMPGYQKIGSNVFEVPVVESNGNLQMKKVSSNQDLTQGNNCYSLEGAVYKVYEDEQLTKEITTLTTDSNGNSNTVSLKKGIYFAKEVKASKGYYVAKEVYRVEVETGKTATFTSIEKPMNDPIDILIKKMDKDTGKESPLGKGTLGDAQFTVKYYAGEYTSLSEVKSLSPTRTWVLKTNKNGRTRFSDSYKVSGDEFYKTETGIITMPMGAITIQETKAPEGYLISDELFFRTITPDGRVEGVSTFQIPIVKEQVIRGGIAIEKWDSEINRREAQGGATLAGAQFDIISLNDNAVSVGGVEYQKNKVIDRITTNTQGVAETTADRYPYGDYMAREVIPPTGYLKTGVVERLFSIRENGKIVKLNTADTAMKNDVIRGDLQLVKFKGSTDDEEDQKKPLEGIIFEITSKTTKKTVEIVTDKNGYASTKQLNISPRGNLVYDTYIVHEKNPPVGIKPVKDFEITIRNEGETLYYILENKTIISPVRLVKLDATTGNRIPVANAEFQLLDKDKNPIMMTTHYPNTVVHHTFKTDGSGSFTLPEKLSLGVYYFREVNAPEGYLRGNDLKFEITKGHEWADPFVVKYEDNPAMGKVTIRKTDKVTGNVLQGAEFELRAKEDIITPDGTIRVKKGELVETFITGQNGTATSKKLFLGKYKIKETKQVPGYILDKKTYDFELKYKDQVTEIVKEIVEITNKPTKIIVDKKVTGGKEKLSGVEFEVWNKAMMEDEELPDFGIKETFKTDETGQIVLERLVPGTYCIQEVKGIPGYVLDKTIFEIIVGEDGRINEQDVGVLEVENARTELIGTTAIDKDTKTRKSVPKKNVTFVDTVEFKNLQIGQEYTIKGKLMDKSTGKPLLINGKEVTEEKTFKPENPDGTVDVEFVFDASALKGKQIVVFEKVYIGEKEILSHEDIEDKKQTIEFPNSKIGTTVKDKDTKTQESVPKKAVTFIDKVEYHNLITGQEYTLKGKLMDKSTEKPLLINGKEVTAEKTFKPENSDGTVDMEFTFDGSRLKGAEIVVFEKLYIQGIEVAGHEDINDKGQTITFPKMKISTIAVDQASKSHTMIAMKNAVIIDTIYYEGAVPGQEYIIQGTAMNRATGKKLQIDGKDITGSGSFVANSNKGNVTINFIFDASKIPNTEVVIFESIYANDIEVASHTDLLDEKQTVKINKKGLIQTTIPKNFREGSKTGNIRTIKTGDSATFKAFMMLILISGFTISYILFRKKRKKDGENHKN